MNLSWELAFPLGVAVLALALAWGMWRSKTRNKANDRITEAAVRERYDHPDTYPARAEALKQQVRPD